MYSLLYDTYILQAIPLWIKWGEKGRKNNSLKLKFSFLLRHFCHIH